MTNHSDNVALGGVPSQIRAEHKQKLAVVYVRQSSPDQVRHHTGSTETQRALAELPRRWGWPESRIKVIEDDLGLSGTSSDQRPGFQHLLELMDRGEVGIVLVREMSRLSRDSLDAERTFRAIAEELNARGFKPPRAKAFTMLQLYQLYQHLKQQGATTNTTDSSAHPVDDSAA